MLSMKAVCFGAGGDRGDRLVVLGYSFSVCLAFFCHILLSLLGTEALPVLIPVQSMWFNRDDLWPVGCVQKLPGWGLADLQKLLCYSH